MTGTRWRWSMSSSIMFLVLLVGLWMPWIMATGTEVSTTATEKKQQGAAVVVEKEKSREDIVGERAKRRQQFAQQVEQLLEKEQIENNKRQLRVDKKSKMDPQDQERLIQLEAFQRKMESLSRPLDDRRVDRLLSREAKWNEVHENASHKKQQQQQQQRRRRAALSPNQDHHKNHHND